MTSVAQRSSSKVELTRGQRIWERVRDEREKGDLVSMMRARLVTEAYRQTEGFPMAIRRALAFEKVLTFIPLRIDEEQLLVGDFASFPMGFEMYPEFATGWIMNDFRSKEAPYTLSDGTLDELEDICEYWKGKSLQDLFLKSLSDEEMQRLTQNSEVGSYLYAGFNTTAREGGYHVPNYEKFIRKGVKGLLEEVQKELAGTRQVDERGYMKANLLKAMIIALGACTKYAHRYSELAKTLAAKTRDPRRKEELTQISEMCRWIPENPARTFYEAVQAMWFCHVFIYLESRCLGTSPGRIDQYLYPYFRRDVDRKKLTKDGAIEILECLRPKMSSLRLFNTQHYRDAASGEAQYHNVTICGQTPDGKDATNELSFLILEAALRTKTPHHTITLRWHKNISEQVLLKAIELVRSGGGFPAFYNDESTIPMLIELGATIEEARNYTISGCVVPGIPNKTSPYLPSLINTAKCFEISLYDGVDPIKGKQVGLKTGKLADFKSADDVMDAFYKQYKHFCYEVGEFVSRQRVVRRAILPVIFQSTLIEDCIQKGEHAQGYGGKFTFGYMIPVGTIDVADSLAAIKRCVFDQKTITKEELLDALKANFDGKEEVLNKLLQAPKFGNDDDYVDEIATRLYSDWRKMVVEIDGPFGTKWLPGPYSVAYHGSCGKSVGALPSGRKREIALADGSVSASQGMDVNGPTAVVNSAGKIDQMSLFMSLFNLKFHPDALKTKEDVKKLLSLIEVFFDYKGKHIQFNVVDRDTLLDAQAYPKKHRNLLVRVAGYSALFVELNMAVQNEIIKRAEHHFQ